MSYPQASPLSRLRFLIQYHRTDQLLHRVKKLVLGKLLPSRLSSRQRGWAESAAHRANLRSLQVIANRRRPARSESSSSIERGQFTFLGITRDLGWPIDWRCQSGDPVSHLWRFHLHYQDTLWTLAGQDHADFPQIWRHVENWAALHPEPTRASRADGWHSFCISRRLANWTLWWSLSPPPESMQALIRISAAKQAAYLADHLEWDLRGNHLMFNLWAIGIAASFFQGELSERLLRLIDAHLPQQLNEQLDEAGEHFERATAYHIEVAELLLDLRDALRPFRSRLSAQCGSIASRMTNLIVGISHPDGTPPLFGDSTLAALPILDRLKRTLVGSLESPSLREARARMIGNYWVWRQNDDCLIFDTGPVGTDELPAHAHCDLLGFEASFGGHKLFIDSGVSSYDDDDVRQYCRSTAAHNALEIDGISQCDVWGKFRMGYRGHPQLLEEGNEEGRWWCHASHDAYRRVDVPVIARHFECRDDRTWTCMDVLWGRGTHQLVSRLHLHPQVQIVQLISPDVILQVGEERVCIHFEGAGGELRTSNGRYCPEFGQVNPITVIEWRRTCLVPAVIQWTLTPVTANVDLTTRNLDSATLPQAPPIASLLEKQTNVGPSPTTP